MNITKTNKFCKKFVALLVMLSVVTTMLMGSNVGNKSVSASSVTGQDVANRAWQAYNGNWAYVYGGSSPGAVDCSGLIASLGVGGNRTSMMSSSPCTGPISTLPTGVVGLGLYMPGHVGVYIGGGMEIDARNESQGVCKSAVSAMGWTNWFYIAGVNYGSSQASVVPSTESESSSQKSSSQKSSSQQSSSTNNTVTVTPKVEVKVEEVKPVETFLGYGSTGESVQALQTRLGELNFYKSGDTGFFGDYTLQCLKNFQTLAGVEATGEFDHPTQDALNSDDAPHYVPPTFKLGDESTDYLQPIQERLVQLEYLKLDSAVGTFDDATLKATNDFQEAAGLPVTGELDNATVDVINSESAPMSPKAVAIDMGATGEDVISLQNKLSQLRYMGDYSSGVYDEATKAAVLKFQANNSHDVTGVISRCDKELLVTDKASKSTEYDNLQLGFRGTDVKALQEKLKRLGYYEGEITGYYDMQTANAVVSFENVNSMTVSEIATPSVRVAIDAAMQAVNINETPNVKSGLTTTKVVETGNNIDITLIATIVLVVATVALVVVLKRKSLKKALRSVSTMILSLF